MDKYTKEKIKKFENEIKRNTTRQEKTSLGNLIEKVYGDGFTDGVNEGKVKDKVWYTILKDFKELEGNIIE